MTQVNIAAQSGDMGILANHVPAIEPLKAGIIEVIESAGQSKKWFGECERTTHDGGFDYSERDIFGVAGKTAGDLLAMAGMASSGTTHLAGLGQAPLAALAAPQRLPLGRDMHERSRQRLPQAPHPLLPAHLRPQGTGMAPAEANRG